MVFLSHPAMAAISVRTTTKNAQGIAALSRQEQLILSLAGQGLADKEIANKIGISMGTVRTYWQRMRDKTNARSRSEILSQCLHSTHSQAVDELQRLKDRFSALVEASSVGLALIDEEEQVVEVNSTFLALVGLTQDEMLGAMVQDVEPLKNLLSNGAGVAVNGGGTMLHVLRQTVQLEGNTFQVLTLIPAVRIPEFAPAIRMF